MHIKSPMKKDKVKKNRRSNNKKSSRSSNRILINGSNGNKRTNGSTKKKKGISLPKLKPWKVIAGAIVLGLLGIVYLNHVFATQELLREVNQLEAEYNRVQRMHTDYKLIYDRIIGPAEIYENAQEAGFINGGPAEKVIEVEK
ncbi:hypothetical protein CK503_06780 [Aliifodinibius salipaludis]|uniref:Cell division protein FtsL n=2 Tax=Fodinibius salipaludis TaxID=2032627 RepID=A0A2A2G9S0_9BACT|nr:hypothetical protein CK503_06780 [Aliifodinibius salipaludis]